MPEYGVRPWPSRFRWTARPKMGRTPHGAGPRAGKLVGTSSEGAEMPKVSKESAAQVEQHGPVEDRHEDLDGYTVNFVSFRAGHRRDAAAQGAARRPLPVPALGLRAQGQHDLPLRRPRGGLRGRRRLLPAARPRPGRRRRAPSTSSSARREELRAVDEAMARNMQAMQAAERLERGWRRAAANSSSGSRPCCIANRLAAARGRGVDLRVDVLDVVADGLRRDHEPLGDLLVRQAAREQPEHLDLARGQPGRALAAPRDAVAGGAEDGLDRLGVEAAGPDLGPQLGGRLVAPSAPAGADAARASPGRRRRRRGSAPGARSPRPTRPRG